jgi:aspartyl-tRNA(Asn)/glutamyl-tRNA(Gln) amidotransferase subunit A
LLGRLGVLEEADLALPNVAKDWLAVGGPERYARLRSVVRSNGAVMGRAFVERVRAGEHVTAERYGEAQKVRARLQVSLGGFFENVDVLVTPATATVAFDARGRLPTSIAGIPVEDPLEVTPFTYPFNFSGHPAITIPAGLTEEGLPVGVQLVAPKYRDDLLLQVAWAYEKLMPAIVWPRQIVAEDVARQ